MIARLLAVIFIGTALIGGTAAVSAFTSTSAHACENGGNT